MRGFPELISPLPIGQTLPAVYLSDAFAQALCSAMDTVLAPVLATLDALPAYFDPGTAPVDMLDFLGEWLGLDIDAHQSESRRRDLVSNGAELLSRRGTVSGVRDAVEAAFDVVPEVIDPGGAHWALEPGTPLPGVADGELVVRLTVPDPAAVDVRRLDAVVASVKPAQVRHRVEVVAAGG